MKKLVLIVYVVVAVMASLNFASAQSDFKVLSYNVLRGFQQDSLIHREYFQWVNEIDPDIVAYQEMNEFTQRGLEDFAAQYGHPYAIQSKLEGYPVALSSKYPIVNVQKVVDNMWHSYLYASINNIHVFVIHFSPFDYKKRQAEMRNVLAHAATLPQHEKILIMGDFNSLSETDAVHYGGEMVEGMRQREKEQNHIRNLNNDEIDYTVMNQLEKAGYKDTFWLTNEAFKPSIPTEKYGSANFRRIDFLWANGPIAEKVKSADIIHDESTDRMSDHYPILVIFDLE